MGGGAGDPTWDTNPETPWSLCMNEVFLIDVTTGDLRRLAHNRNKNTADDYSQFPKPALSLDGTLVLFHSNFGVESGSYADIYTVSTGLANTASAPAAPTGLTIAGTQ